ncbi:MAG: MBL fold metallo-hydrolase [Kiritimatiellia bacterium]|jgi:glyoxylase-like metal-dependent hydrolase (beta-lactamase superfamily II)|nr:MBL fold metallo-hydrolase [Kiritimatiellia bacterium]
MDWSIVEGNRQKMDGGAMFGNAPKALWSRWHDCDSENRIDLLCHCLVVRTEGFTAIMDTGVGAFMDPKYASRFGVEQSENVLLSNLAAKGIAESDVDYVILSHLHFDHVGGILPDWPGIESEDWSPLFPNAKYVLAERQWERAQDPHPRDRASYTPGVPEKLMETGRLVLLRDDDPLIPELDGIISFEFSDGHTPGLLHAIVQADGETLFFASDMISGPAWVHCPIVTGYDRNPELMIDEKRQVLERAVAGNWIVIYDHDPVVAASRIVFDESKGKFSAGEIVKGTE